MKKTGYGVYSLAMFMALGGLSLSGSALASPSPASGDAPGNTIDNWDPGCQFGRYDGPCMDVGQFRGTLPAFDACKDLARSSGAEVHACEQGANEGRTMAEQFGGGHGHLFGYLRGFSWGMHKLAESYSQDAGEIQIGRQSVGTLSSQLQQASNAGGQAGEQQGQAAGASEARNRFAAAMGSGQLPSAQFSIPATSYAGVTNAYSSYVGAPETPPQMLQNELANLRGDLQPYNGLDNPYMGNYDRDALQDLWYGDGVYRFDSHQWLDQGQAMQSWLGRRLGSRDDYDRLNQNIPMVPVKDASGRPVIDPRTHQPEMKPAYDAQALFRDAFQRSYNYYVNYYYASALYQALAQGEDAGELVGIELGKRMARQAGMIQEFNSQAQNDSVAAYRAAFAEGYPSGFRSTYADYQSNPKLEVKFDGIVGSNGEGIIQPGERVSVRLEVSNYGGVGTPLAVSLSGDITGGTTYSDSIGALTSKTITTPILGQIDNRLHDGDSAQLELEVNNLPVLTQSEVIRTQVELGQSDYQVNTTQGSGLIHVNVSNVSTARSAGQVTVGMEVNGQKTSQNLGFLNPGETRQATLQFSGIDPMTIIGGSARAAYTVTMGDAVMGSDSLTLNPTNKRADMASYFNELVNGRGFVAAGSDHDAVVASLSALIVSTNYTETKHMDKNLYQDDPSDTMLGLVVNAYQSGTQSDVGKQSYKKLGDALWEHRNSFFKFLFFKSGKRKSYEALCKKLPI